MADNANDRKRLEELAAIVSGVMVGAAGYRSGRLIDPKETVEDALTTPDLIAKLSRQICVDEQR
jgi:hypothetical protein